MSPGARIDYKTLRQINPEAARKAVLEYLKTNGGNKADVARLFGGNSTVVYYLGTVGLHILWGQAGEIAGEMVIYRNPIHFPVSSELVITYLILI